MYFNFNPIYFLHIPKTAGSTVRVWLRELVAEGEYLEADFPDRVLANATLIERHWRMHLGHLGWSVPELRPEIAVITFLREPTSLYRSLFDFAVGLDYTELTADLAPAAQSLELLARSIATSGFVETLSSPHFKGHYGNLLVRTLTSGVAQMSRRPRRLSEEDLHLAQRRLETMPFVGMAEDMETSAALFAHAFRLPFRPLVMRLNRTAKPSLPRHGWPEAVARENPLDVKLYEFCRGLFTQRWLDLLDRNGLPHSTPAGDLEEILRATFLSAEHDIVGMSAFKADPSSDLMMTGFHRRFCRNGRWLRWSGPGKTSRLYLPLDRVADRHVRLDVLYARSETARLGLKISTDGRPAEARCTFWKDKGDLVTSYKFVVPKSSRILPARLTEIEIVAPEVLPIPGMNLGDENVNQGAFALGSIAVE